MKTFVLAASWLALKAALTVTDVLSPHERDDFTPEAA